MRADGSYTDDEWNSIVNEGGAGVIPSFVGIEYGAAAVRSTPSTGYSWLCSAIGLFLLLPSALALVLALRCIRRGNRWGWAAAVGSVASAAGFFALASAFALGR